MAFLDDVYVSTLPDSTGDAHAAPGKHMHSKADICLHHGKTKIWNSQGEKPKCVDVLEKDARQLQPEAVGWRGNPEQPVSKQGLRVLGGAGGPSQLHPGAVGAEGRRAQGVSEEEYQSSKMCSQLGYFCCIALLREPIIG